MQPERIRRTYTKCKEVVTFAVELFGLEERVPLPSRIIYSLTLAQIVFMFSFQMELFEFSCDQYALMSNI